MGNTYCSRIAALKNLSAFPGTSNLGSSAPMVSGAHCFMCSCRSRSEEQSRNSRWMVKKTERKPVISRVMRQVARRPYRGLLPPRYSVTLASFVLTLKH